MRYNTLQLILFSASLCSSSLAVGQVSSHFEKAGTLKKDNAELSFQYTNYTDRYEGKSETVNSNPGLRFGYGITENFDLKLRYELILPPGGFDNLKGVNYVSIVPKYSLFKNKIAFLLPLSYYSYRETTTEGTFRDKQYSISPQFLFTLTSKSNQVDITGSIKSDLFFDKVSDFYFGASLGAGFSKDLNKWAIRPEIGIQYLPNDRGNYLNYGLAFHLLIPSLKAK